ncbi:MAG: hypothetical protein KJ648_07125 [Candidatus Omnitrophica bacterium]|nr:hypothetical protein [Candidatus Omnitrophota bacterium]
MSESKALALRFTQKDGFTQIEDPLYTRDGANFDDELKEGGYIEYHGVFSRYGVPDSETLTVYRKADYPTEFIVDLQDSGSSIPVVVSGLDNLFALHERMIPLITAFSIDYSLQNLSAIARKGFRAWHGHYPEDVCSQCDPEAIRQHLLDIKQRLLDKKQKASEVTP